MNKFRAESKFYPDDLLGISPMEQRFLLRGWLMAVVDDAEYRDVPREIVIEALNDVVEAFSKNRSEATK
jgi:hypothetical protein